MQGELDKLANVDVRTAVVVSSTPCICITGHHDLDIGKRRNLGYGPCVSFQVSGRITPVGIVLGGICALPGGRKPPGPHRKGKP